MQVSYSNWYSVFVAMALIIGTTTPAGAQGSRFNLEKELARRDLSEVQERVRTFTQENSGTAESLYLRAVMHTDAKQAMELYNQVKTDFPEAPQAALATFQMGNYYFARGLYISARRFFLDIVENYGESPLVPQAMYLAASSMCAARQSDTCSEELQNFVSKYRKSPFARLARSDLKALGTSAMSSGELSSRVTFDKGKYTLQLGAFSQANNALNLRNYFTKLGFPVEIRKVDADGKSVFVVWLGSFESRSAARAFGDNLKKDHGKPYRIVSK